MKTFWKQRIFFILLLPGLIYYILYLYAPFFGAVIAFKDFKIKQGIFASPWADPLFKHFLNFVKSPYFSTVIPNTLIISFSKMLLGMPFAIGLAIMLFEVRSKAFRKTVQTLTYMPHFLSWVIVYGMMMALLSETTGLLNLIIYNVFGKKIPFFTSPKIFRWLIILSDVWKNTGWSAIIYLAAISGIDPTLYQVADIDGASRWQCIWHITIPSIMGLVVIMLILSCGRILNAGFDQIFVMYNPMVYSTSDIIDTWVYRTGIEKYEYSLASAVGLFKSLVSLVLVVTVNKIAGFWGEAAW